MRCDEMRCDEMRCDGMRCDGMRCDGMRCDEIRCNTDAMRCNATFGCPAPPCATSPLSTASHRTDNNRPPGVLLKRFTFYSIKRYSMGADASVFGPGQPGCLSSTRALRGVDEFLGPAFFAGCSESSVGVKLATWSGGERPATGVPTPLSSLKLTQQQLGGLTSIDVEPLTGRAMRYALRTGRYARLVVEAPAFGFRL